MRIYIQQFLFDAPYLMSSVDKKKRNVVAVVVTSFTVAMMAACASAAVVAAAPPAVGGHAPQIWDSSRLLALCFLGAICGTVVRVFWSPVPPAATEEPRVMARLLAGKATVSMICGLVATPMALRYMQWQPEADLLVAVSASVAFVGDLLVIPALVRVIQYQTDRQEKKLQQWGTGTEDK